ncbi:unnamed protein product, partial [Sphagnum jensenii]
GVLLLGPDVIKATSSKQGSVDGAIPRELLAASGCVALVQVHKGIARSYYPQSSHMQLILNCSLIPFSFSRSLSLDSTRASCSKRVRNVEAFEKSWRTTLGPAVHPIALTAPGIDKRELTSRIKLSVHWNLCAKVGVECKEHCARAQTATQTREWVVAYSEWTSCRDIIVRSEGLLDRDEWLWLSGCHELVSANLWAFHSMNFGLALAAAIAALKAWAEFKNVPEALDFKFYLLPTLWKVLYLWASTSDCEEETLDPDVKKFVNVLFEINVLLHPRDSVPDSKMGTLKKRCKKFIINNCESVIWEVQKHYFNNSKTEECLRWAREGNVLYQKKYPDQLDYVSKLNEAATLFMSGACEEVIEVCEKIRDNLESKPWQGNGADVYPAARYCTLEYAFMIRQMLCICYQKMTLKPGHRKWQMIDNASKEREECESLWAQMQSDENLLPLRKCLAEAGEHAENNRWEEAKACFGTSWGQSLWGRVEVPHFLEKLHTDFKIKYRQSYERGSPDESLFSSAESWAEILRESKNYSLSLSQWEPRNFVRLVQLYHEKDREVMFLKQSPIMGDVNTTAPVVEYGRKAIECYVKALCQHTEHDDYWIAVQELYKDVYYMLQFHNFALWIRSHECTLGSTINIQFPDRLQQLWNQSLMSEGASADSSRWQEILRQSLVWAEGRVGKTIYFQLAPNMLSTSAMEQLRDFDLNQDEAWKTLKSSRNACGPRTVVLEYFVSKSNDLQFVYVMTKEDEVFMQILKINGLDSIFWYLLQWLRNMCSGPTHQCEGALINGCLEWIYEMLISPVANFLDNMEQEDKLIIVAPQVLSDVPFAALRKPNSPVRKGYLVQSHTISVTSSLRMLQHCDQRLKELEKGLLDAKPGTIVAVGDPVGDQNCLQASVEEVNFIEDLFCEKHVKKLVGPEATPAKVLEWAKYPSENRVKQVVFHIAAHGIEEDADGKVGKGGITLSPPPISSQQNDGQGAMHRAQDDNFFDDDNAHDETELRDFMVDGKEEAQISSHGEVGGIRTGIVVPISKHAPHILKSENISGCGFQWEAHMVVLSACDSARGQITGEGVLNLPRALMIAGVPSVVVSQWKVGDQSTCDLMKGFYLELRSGKDVSSSLRAAMLKMIENERKVHEWAPFFVCGLPTVCLPKELQDVTSCKAHERGMSSDTKAELRVKDVKVKPLDLGDSHIKRLFELANAEPFCFICLGELGTSWGLNDMGDESGFWEMEAISRELNTLDEQRQT